MSNNLVHHVLVDPTLTVDVLVDVMEKLTSDEERRRNVWRVVLEWEDDLRSLCIPSSYIDEVYTQLNTSAREKTQALSDVYVNIRPESSWRHLVGILYRESELVATKQAKSFLPVNGGWCVVHVYNTASCIGVHCGGEMKSVLYSRAMIV